ncbi:MAG TPA: helix-turn-helix domain-containing protein [Nitrososphaera sp.]|nr:helix-turn-helix domain-containing protein [Nitrososphaera sp.]
MHNIPNAYPLFRSSEHMVSAIETTTRIDAQLLKQISRMYETGISLKDISEELGIGQKTVKRLLKLLGYTSAD